DVQIGNSGRLRGLVPYTELARVIRNDAGKNQNVYVKVGGSAFAPSGQVGQAPPLTTEDPRGYHVFGKDVRAAATRIQNSAAQIVATYPQSKLDSRISSLRLQVFGVIVA